MITKEEFKKKTKKYLEEYAGEIFNFYNGGSRRVKDSWNATDLGRCLRGVYLERLGGYEPRELGKYTKNIFHEGKMKELELIVRLILEGYEILDTQTELYNEEFDVKGHPDVVVYDIQNNRTILEEIKTVNSRSFWYRVIDDPAIGDVRFDPYPNHILQISFYLHELRAKYPDIYGRLRYKSRDDGTEMLCSILYEGKIWLEITRQFDILQQAWKTKTPPPVPDTIIYDNRMKRYTVNYVASYCDYHNYCLNSQNWSAEAHIKVKELNDKRLKVNK